MSKIRLTLISDEVERDPFNRIFSVTRAYRTRLVYEFPTDGKFWVTVFWDDSADADTQVSFEILDSEGSVIDARPPTRAFVDQLLKITFVHFSEVLFQYADVYRVNVYANGELADVAQFTLSEPSEN